MDELQAGVEQALAVLPQSPVFLQPGEAALDDPTLGHELEGMSLITLGNLYRHVLTQYLAHQVGMQVVIPPKKNRKVQREYDKHLYRQRHLIENAFLHLKRWRGIATRYAKNVASFVAAVQIRCIALWAKIL
jgi:transposase